MEDNSKPALDSKEDFMTHLGIEIIESTPDLVRMRMPITDRVTQMFGFVHGGATIALLESAASLGATLRADLEKELPFGIESHICHRKAGKAGYVHGIAQLDRCEKNKQYWDVIAYDSEGDVMSQGTFVTKIVARERLAEKERERAAEKERERLLEKGRERAAEKERERTAVSSIH